MILQPMKFDLLLIFIFDVEQKLWENLQETIAINSEITRDRGIVISDVVYSYCIERFTYLKKQNA